MKGILEQLDSQHNPFVDTIVSSLAEDPELLASIVGAKWSDDGILLVRVEPVSSESFDDLKEIAVEKIREAGKEVNFKCACRVVVSQGIPNMLFKIQQKQ